WAWASRPPPRQLLPRPLLARAAPAVRRRRLLRRRRRPRRRRARRRPAEARQGAPRARRDGRRAAALARRGARRGRACGRRGVARARPGVGPGAPPGSPAARARAGPPPGMDFVDRLIDLALEEDLGAAGDVTTQALVPEGARGRAEVWAKETLVLSGTRAFARVFTRLEPAAEVRFPEGDGARIGGRAGGGTVSASRRTLLVGERTALNILQRTCGIATLKTSPGMRGLSKEAVRAGGASNHRFGLFDGVLIKDNHLAAVGGDVREALRRARAHAPLLVKIEIEVTGLAQLPDAIAGGADVVLLDNMDDATVAEAVRIAAGRVKFEVSGNVTLERLPGLAQLGVDYVSMGALTHSARAMDLSLEIVER